MSDFDVWTFNSPPSPEPRRTQDERIAELQAENAALWAFVWVSDVYDHECEGMTFKQCLSMCHDFGEKRDALRKYEKGGKG